MSGFQSIQYEDPKTLPFKLPASLADIDAKWMTDLLRHRKVISETCEVTSVEKKGVGMTAGYFSAIEKVKCTYSEETSAITNFVCKAWPSFELLPKEAIKTMFVNDMKGYSEFAAEDWYPRPDVYLATYDEAEDRWALVMEDCGDKATHCVHENPLSLEQVKKMIPALVNTAVKFEGCGEEGHPLFDNCKHVPNWSDAASIYVEPFKEGAMLVTRFMNNEDPWGVDEKEKFGWKHMHPHKNWNADLGGDYVLEFSKAYKAFWDRSSPANGATQTISHGDLRGDNIFWNEETDQWMAIDFQLTFKGPIASDLAYLMNSGSVQPDVYENHTDEILQEFHSQFIEKTQKYKELSFEKFKEEYVMMGHVLFTYYIAMGAAIWKAATMDHDGGLGASLASPNGVGSGAITYADLPESEKRKRYWWSSSFNNFRVLVKDNSQLDLVNSLAKEEVDFKAAFNYEAAPGCPWPKNEDGSFADVDVPTAQALANGALPDDKASALATDGKISMEKFVGAVVPGWALLFSLSQKK